jgi:hypothetical protein
MPQRTANVLLVVVVVAAACVLLPSAASARGSATAPDGSVVVIGTFVVAERGAPFSNPYPWQGAVGIDRGGRRLAGFGHHGAVAGAWSHVARLPDGGLVMAGVDGQRDPSMGLPVRVTWFGPDGAFLHQTERLWLSMLVLDDLQVTADGGALLAGHVAAEVSRVRPVLAAVGPDGRLRTAFGHDGIASPRGSLRFSATGPAFGGGHGSVARGETAGLTWVLPDGRIITGGPGLVARFLADGTPDPSWGDRGEVTVRDAADGVVVPDGAGAFTIDRVDEASVLRVTRLRSDGRPDPAYGDGGTAGFAVAVPDSGAEIRDAVLGPDGRLTVGLWTGFGFGTAVVLHLPPGASGPVARVVTPMDGYIDLSVAGGEITVVGTIGAKRQVDNNEPAHTEVAHYDADLGLLDSVAVRRVFTGPPAVSRSGPPRRPGAVTGTRARFALTFMPRSEDQGLGSLSCSLDRAPRTPCGPLVSYTGLREGPHALAVYGIGIDDAPSSPITYRWIQNDAAPDTQIIHRPPRVSHRDTMHITFRTSEPATVTCRLDAHPRGRCTSPLTIRGLRPGHHLVRILARDRLGARERHAAVVAWRRAR